IALSLPKKDTGAPLGSSTRLNTIPCLLKAMPFPPFNHPRPLSERKLKGQRPETRMKKTYKVNK
ncbi:MAG: hypothetical protein KAR20_13060, partial [Candidatus Heimdallarchaeota archaeon]|nr:hypothetical protein [Candidatus Heimdallarchaeota archaeon]